MASQSTGWNTSPTTNTKGGDVMPHVIVKAMAEQSRAAEASARAAVTEDAMRVLRYREESVSVAFEEVDADAWAERVY